MRGKLEILCGPSGAGKTSSGDKPTISYRWTSRQIRDGEICSERYDGSQQTHGFFKTEGEFLEAVAKGELIGVHRYPNPKTGNWYGFPRKDIKDALERGEHISEQVVDYDALDEIVDAFEEQDITKTLFLSDPWELEKRINASNRGDAQVREEVNIANIKKYLKNLSKFNRLTLNPPTVVKEVGNIRTILSSLIDDLTECREPSIEFDFPDNTIWNLLSAHKAGEIAQDQILIILHTLRESVSEEMQMTKSYPCVSPTAAYECFLNYQSASEPAVVSVPFGLNRLMRIVGMEDEAQDVLNETYKGIEKIRARDNLIENTFQRIAFTYFVGNINGKLKTFKDDASAFHHVLASDFLRTLFMRETGGITMSGVTAIERGAKFLNDYLARNMTARELLAPGIEEIKALHTLNFRKIFDTYSFDLDADERMRLYCYGAHISCEHAFLSNIAPDDDHTVPGETIRHRNIEEFSKVYCDVLPDVTTEHINERYVSVFASLLAAGQGTLASYLNGLSRNTSSDEKIVMALNLMHYSAAHPMKLVLDGKVPKLLEGSIGYSIAQMMRGVTDVTLTDSTYPKVEGPVEFVRRYWIDEFETFEHYVKYAIGKAASFIDEVEREALFKGMGKYREYYENSFMRAMNSLTYIAQRVQDTFGLDDLPKP